MLHPCAKLLFGDFKWNMEPRLGQTDIKIGEVVELQEHTAETWICRCKEAAKHAES